ncbi:prokaryotic RING finger family 4 [Capnocytophaga sp. CM59]|uniref:prokaryotic RING finger family 4 n=1 Tax=Capnocytophaga sp. CM59 TaxID=936370 RepID=UPI00027C6AC1|nr:prokaryotic RING finger family 4 [Capnocytophaga sp. CM59]EJU26715.1 prokaryotic RING finger family 4 [Capnocytophaga sp. CM59]
MEKITALLKVALRQNALFVPDMMPFQKAIQPGTLELVAALRKHGFGLTENLLHAINGTTNEYRQSVVKVIKEVLHVKLNWAPLIKNWEVPTGEGFIDHLITAFYNQYPHLIKSDDYFDYLYEESYKKENHKEPFTPKHERFLACGHYIPYGTFPLDRYNGCPFCGTPFELGEIEYQGQGSKLKILDLWREAEANTFFQNLLSSKTALDATQSDSLKLLLPFFSVAAETRIGMKETLVLVVDSYIAQGEEAEAGACFSSPTDILRYLWYKRTGFLQIVEPKTIMKKDAKNNCHIVRSLDLSMTVKERAQKELKLKYSRQECARVACWLNALPLSAEKACEIMHPKREMWVRFIRALRLAEYSKKKGFEKLATLLDVFYNERYSVWQAELNAAYQNMDSEKAFFLLKQRPGVFARSLFACMLWLGADDTLSAFKEIIDQVPTRLLFTLNTYADLYFSKEGKRSVQTILGTRVEIPKHPLVVESYNEEQLAEMKAKIEDLCLWTIQHQFAKEENKNHFIYIDPQLYHIPLPIGDRSHNVHDFNATLMGTRFPLEGNEIRLFMQWGKDLPAQHLDMDLSCRIIYKDRTDICYFGQLTTLGCQHSGDIRSIPDKIGTAEYINIDVNTLRQHKAKYVTFVCNAYSCGALSPNLVVGWMDSKYKMKVSERTGVAYDPSAVIHQVRITQPLQKGLLFGVLDVEAKEIIWMELPFQGQVAQALSISGVNALLEKLNSKFTIGNLLKLKAEAQGLQIENDPTLADEVYDMQWAGQGKVSELFFK